MLMLNKNVMGEEYKKLINILSEHCDCFAFVERRQLMKNEKERLDYITNLTTKIQGNLIKTNIQSKWETTALGGGNTAYVFYFELNDTTSEFLKEKSNSLFEWHNPKLPEDLMFYQNDKCLLAGCSHEGFFMVDEALWNSFLLS
ncbi:stage III sporulation protein AH [Metasolibacillus meyeri]|uniref:Stage III sporulation protein AH n=1 Tax=Metasolibacillus meyeri TaxID=1071052 RepID=A0AAW9NU41_9BACL|nr:stage III sporulation protein AH [Metasolibacillus meyeri]MEC1178271.1 stage III sporulation protein AH [Metasolibacillus meyeri]